jgi:hypothetical protein
LVLIGLVAASVGLRFALQAIPNFAPVAAVALFSGFYFRSRALAALAPLSIMLISDTFLGGYQPVLMLTVYALLTLPVLLRGPMRQCFAFDDSAWGNARSLGGLLGCSLAASVLFFLVTNFVTWYVTPWYPRTPEGLVHCYTSALPFFRYTLAGDAFFALVLFGGYAAVSQSATATQPELAAAR